MQRTGGLAGFSCFRGDSQTVVQYSQRSNFLGKELVSGVQKPVSYINNFGFFYRKKKKIKQRKNMLYSNFSKDFLMIQQTLVLLVGTYHFLACWPPSVSAGWKCQGINIQWKPSVSEGSCCVSRCPASYSSHGMTQRHVSHRISQGSPRLSSNCPQS